MTNTGRVTASLNVMIEAPAEQVWQLLTDWGGFPLRAQMPGVTDVSLIGEANAVPRTRKMTFEDGGTLLEEVFHQDDVTRRLYCRLVGEEVLGLRGYVATVFVDATADDQCQLSLQASCDLRDSAMVEQAREGIIAGWSSGIVAGTRRCIAQDSA